MGTVKLAIDGVQVEAAEGSTVLEAAQRAGIYIPALCYHPDLPPFNAVELSESVYRGAELVEGDSAKHYEGCGLCLAQIDGMEGFPTSCTTVAANGMVVHTNTPEVQELRKDNLVAILSKHPHACLLCAQRQGCSLTQCSSNVPELERCCSLFNLCELRKVADYIGIRDSIPRYIFQDLPTVRDEPLFERNHNLCVACTRCVRACQKLRGVGALAVTSRNGETVVGTAGPSLNEAECRFCGACVAVCPTGALTDRGRQKLREEAALVPCSYTCPAGIDVPSYVHLAAQGKFDEALAVIRQSVPFPGVLGYVCHHPCESKCRHGELNEPISIRAVKRFVAEHDTGQWKKRVKLLPPSGKRVAIVGSGPAGLTAAYYLSRMGHAVTVFEALPEPGGMMRFGIPEYRLPREVLKKEIDEILSQDRIELKTATSVGGDVPLADLKAQGYDAVFLASGTHTSRRLDIEGAARDGVVLALDFLREVNLGRSVAVRDRVLVIGGGGVAIDAALCARRLGAREVQLACLESRKEMPAHEQEIQDAVDEGVVLNVSRGPKKITGEGAGKVTGVEFVRCLSVFDDQGRFAPLFDESTTTTIETDMVIFAIGQAADLSYLGSESGIELARGIIRVDKETLATTAQGIFAGGDVASGPASVIEAVAAGRKAASSIDRYLGGQGTIDEDLVAREAVDHWLGRQEGFARKARVRSATLPADQRVRDFATIEQGFDKEMVLAEAERCLRCNLRPLISPVPLPPEEWLEFNSANVDKVPEKGGAYQLLDEKHHILYIKGAANLRDELKEKLNSYNKARYFGYEENQMYSKRESELIQQFLQQNGRMPEGNEELEELIFD